MSGKAYIIMMMIFKNYRFGNKDLRGVKEELSKILLREGFQFAARMDVIVSIALVSGAVVLSLQVI